MGGVSPLNSCSAAAANSDVTADKEPFQTLCNCHDKNRENLCKVQSSVKIPTVFLLNGNVPNI